MKVLKFGGTSVGSVVKSILSVKQIVEKEAKRQSVIVVVSALGGITDQLLRTARMACKGDNGWKASYQQMVERHHSMIDTIFQDPIDKVELFNQTDALLEQLRSIFFGVNLIQDLSQRTEDVIVSYGERLSSRIVARLIQGSRWFDPFMFIKTTDVGSKHILDSEVTYDLVCQTFHDAPRVAVVPGFIATDCRTGEITNLGRGGSDYTASIIAAALKAEALEIWTDVDGFMTADPKVIKTAYTINELSYVEAMELCNFGAKVIYPPTIYPVCIQHIPIRVRNTFNPSSKGTVIKDEIKNDQKPIKGISSIKGTSLITVSGLSMVGVIGVNHRIFSTLAKEGVSVFLVAQASSENSTSIGVQDGRMFPMHAESGLATIGIVGENMKHTPGIAGKLFGVLGRSGISVIACAQGASETNISFVIQSKYLRKALNVIHDSFFLSEYKVLNLFICGVGTVGGKLIEQIRQQYDRLKETSRLKLNVVGIASSHHAIYDRDGLDLADYRKQLDTSEESTPKKLHDTVIGMNIFNSVFVDCTASKEISNLYQDLLEHNISVIAANKLAASSDYEDYIRLKRTAIARGVKFRFETNVGAGLPIIGTINDLLNSGDRVLKIEAVLSGTLNFIFNEISADVPFSETVRRAKEEGYSEPDPRIDLSGTDVVRKLVILTRESGYRIEQENVEKDLFVPDDYFNGSVEDFWKRLPLLDAGFEEKRKKIEAEGKRWRFVAEMEAGKAKVSLKAVDRTSPFYNLEGSNNVVLLTTERYKEYPMQIQGYGAGADVTAAGVLANIMSIANI